MDVWLLFTDTAKRVTVTPEELRSFLCFSSTVTDKLFRADEKMYVAKNRAVLTENIVDAAGATTNTQRAMEWFRSGQIYV